MRRNTGALQAAPGVIGGGLILIGLALWFWVSLNGGEGYSGLARGLQIEAPALPPEAPWRDGPPREASAPGWLGWIGVALGALGRALMWAFNAFFAFVSSIVGLVSIGAALLAGVVYLIVKYGNIAGPSFSAPAGGRAYGEAGASLGDVAETPKQALPEILAMEDLDRALGALLRLALQAAARLSDATLARSDTAREALRRLPETFEFLAPLKALVREAEFVRFAGAPITRERFVALAESVRVLIERAEALEGGQA